MNQDIHYSEPNKTINLKEYDHIISIGNKCASAMMLRDIKVYKDSYPFDFVPTQPHLILKYIKSFEEFLPDRKNIRNKDDVWFGHFKFADKYDETVETFERRIQRLYDRLNSTNKILFVYTTEADVYNEMNSAYNDNYSALKKLRDYLLYTYPASFDILAVHTNKAFEDEPSIINFTLNVADKHISKNMETHVASTFNPYRKTLRELLKQILL